MRTRTRLTASTALALTIALTGALAVPAGAAATARHVVSGVHADVVSVSFADNTLALGSTATVDGEVNSPVDPAATTFNVESATRTTLGRGSNLPFLGDIGNQFWIAPQTNPEGALLWPGVNTEGIPSGVADDDTVAVSLTSVDGPGFLSVYQTDSFGTHTRLLDSRAGSGYDTWQIPVGQHQHANWAFSATGEYTLTFTAQTVIDGAPQTARQDYHFFVGNMVPAVSTVTTAPLVSATAVRAGDEVTMSSTVAPQTARGSVEFSTGTESLGYADVVDGVASLATDRLPIGRQTISAQFTPDSPDDYLESISTPTVVTVSPARAEGSFGIATIPRSYTDGETGTLSATGTALATGENYQWVIRQAGSDDAWQTISDDLTYRAETGATFTRVMTTDYDGYEIALQIQRDHLLLAQSAPVTISVPGPSLGTGLDVRLGGVKAIYPYGEYTEFTVLGEELPAGARYEWYYFYPRSNDPVHVTDLGDPSGVNRKSVFLSEAGILPVGVRIVAADGTILGTSPRYEFTLGESPTLQIEGIKSFYHPGDTIDLTATVTPKDSPFTRYRWSIYDRAGTSTVIEGASGGRVSLPASLDLNEATISVVLVEPTRGEKTIAYDAEKLIVLDPAAADLVYFTPLARHYHSGDAINLRLISSSASEGDSYRWYIKRADQSAPTLLAGVTTATHRLIAEVALAGAQVTAELVNADGTVLATTAPAYIAVDDHGTPPPRNLAITTDAQQYPAGTTATLTATASPASVLDRYEWWSKPAAAGDAVLLGVTRTNTFSLPVAAGAVVFARLTKETGETYIQSDPLSVRVTTPAPGDENTPPVTPVDPAPAEPTPSNPTPGTPQPVPGPAAPVPTVPGSIAPVVPVPSPTQPESPQQSPQESSGDPRPTADAELTPATELRLASAGPVAPGGSVTVDAGAAHAGVDIAVWLHSTPRLIATTTTNSQGRVAITVPSDTAPGQHRVVLQDASGALIGWAGVTIAEPQPARTLASTGFDAAPSILAALFLVLSGIALFSRRTRRTSS
jgi:surface-anchored protein